MAFSLNNKSVAMIPAAGLGTRLGAITLQTPKPLVEVQGITMLERACRHLADAGFKRIAINTHHLAGQIHAAIPALSATFPSIDFHISHEPKLLDIGGGMKKVARDLRVDEMLIFNSDTLLYGDPKPLAPLLNAWDAGQMDTLLFLKSKDDLYADFNLNEIGQLQRLTDKSNHDYIYAGISIYRTAPLLAIGTDIFHIMKDYIFPKMAAEHNFYGIKMNAGCIDVGTPEGLAAAKAMKIQHYI